MDLKLLSDQAILEGSSRAEDGLGFGSYSEVLKKAALGTEGPFTIGVFGEWGTGKTSLLNMIQDKLNKEPKESNIVTVWFNAWRYEKETHPIIPLIASIIKAIERHETFLVKTNIKKNTRNKLIKALRAVAYGLSTKTKFKVPGFAEFEANFVAKDMIEREEKLSSDPLLERSLYFNAFERLSNIDLNEGKIVVFIDDLDRCFPNQAIRLLESIKLVLCQAGFIFYLGVSPRIIEGYLRHRYKDIFGITDFKSHEYLDKIVQLPFYIPKHQDRMKKVEYAKKIEKQLDKKHKDIIKDIIPIIAPATRNNPRATIRFINNLLIYEAINQHTSKDVTEHIPIKYFAITICLQHSFRNIYNMLYNNQNLCKVLLDINLDKPHAADIEAPQGLSAEQMDELKGSIQLDEDFRLILGSSLMEAWLEDESMRRASIDFISRTSVEYEEHLTKPSIARGVRGVGQEEIRRAISSAIAMSGYNIKKILKDMYEITSRALNTYETSRSDDDLRDMFKDLDDVVGRPDGIAVDVRGFHDVHWVKRLVTQEINNILISSRSMDEKRKKLAELFTLLQLSVGD